MKNEAIFTSIKQSKKLNRTKISKNTKNALEVKATERGFMKGEFVDRYGAPCSIQESSIASERCIWLGVDDANPQILVFDAFKLGLPGGSPIPNGWIPYDIPKEVFLTTRMHLTQDMVKKLLPRLQHFAKTGLLT